MSAATASAPREHVADRPWMIGVLAAVFVGATVLTVARHPDGVIVSSDPGYLPVPVPLLLAPAALTIALTLLLPRGDGDARVRVRRPLRLRWETAALTAVALVAPVLLVTAPGPAGYGLTKVLAFITGPCLVLGLLARRGGPSVSIDRPAVPWWAPLLPALALGLLSNVGPFAPGPPSQWPDPVVLIVGATGTAITAGLGEELLYRWFLQTRLEAILGPWTGLLLASLLFGSMHVLTHGSGPLWDSAPQALAMQGTTGIALGLVWMRWRRLWPCVLAHVLLNGTLVILHLLGYPV